MRATFPFVSFVVKVYRVLLTVTCLVRLYATKKVSLGAKIK